MSLCKQAWAPARGGGLLGRPWLRVPLNGCQKTKPFQSVPWKRETAVLGMAERESELHVTDRELWFGLSYWPKKKDTENMCCWQSRRQTTSDISDGKGNLHFQSVFDYVPSLFYPALMFFFFKTAIHYCPVQFDSRTMMLIFSCPTFTFPNHYEIYSKHESLKQPQRLLFFFCLKLF